jgi:hypothetical protein
MVVNKRRWLQLKSEWVLLWTTNIELRVCEFVCRTINFGTIWYHFLWYRRTRQKPRLISLLLCRGGYHPTVPWVLSPNLYVQFVHFLPVTKWLKITKIDWLECLRKLNFSKTRNIFRYFFYSSFGLLKPFAKIRFFPFFFPWHYSGNFQGFPMNNDK